MALRVNETRRNPQTGRVERTGRQLRPVYRERAGGGYTTEFLADDDRRPGDLPADRGLARAQADAENTRALEQRREYEAARQRLLDQPGGGGGFSTAVDGREGFSSATFVNPRGGGRVSDVAASSPSFVASTRRSPNEFVLAEGGRAVPTTSTREGAFLYRDVTAPRQTTNAAAITIERAARRDPFLRPARFAAEYRRNYRKTVGGFAGRAAEPFENFAAFQTRRAETASGFAAGPQRAGARSAEWLGRAGAGYFRARERTPELFLADAASIPAGYGAGVLAGRSVNAGVQFTRSLAFTSGSPRVGSAILAYSPSVFRAGATGGRYAAAGLGVYGAYQAARNPEAFGAYGVPALGFFGGAGVGFGRTYGLQTAGPVRYGRPRAELRADEYGPNTLSVYSQREVTQPLTLFGRPYTRRGTQGVSGLLRRTERGGYTGELTVTSVVGPERATTQTPFNVYARGYRGGDLLSARNTQTGQAYAIYSNRPRLRARETALNLDPVFSQTGRVATVDPYGRVTRSRPYRAGQTGFNYAGRVYVGQTRAQAPDTSILYTYPRSAARLDANVRGFYETAGVRPTRAPTRRGYGAQALDDLYNAGYGAPRRVRAPAPRALSRDRVGALRLSTRQQPRAATLGARETPFRGLGAFGEVTAPIPAAATGARTFTFIQPAFRQRPSTRQQPRTRPDQLANTRTRFETRAGATYAQVFAPVRVTAQRSRAEQIVAQPGLAPTRTAAPLPFAPVPPPPLFAGLPFVPFGAAATSRPGTRARGATRGFSYTPSLAAVFGNVRSRSAPGTLLGLEVRPIVTRRR